MPSLRILAHVNLLLPLMRLLWVGGLALQAGGGGKEPLRMELRQLIGDEGERAAARQQPHRPYQDQQREGGAVHGEQSSSYAEYAAAALAGLPQEDEAVKVWRCTSCASGGARGASC